METKKLKLSSFINKGLLIVYGPLVSFVVACGFIANWFATNIMKSDIADLLVVLTVPISICIGWTWWSYKIVKWKFWAFSQIGIENSYQLYERAINVGLIWPIGSLFNKTEIWTEKDKENWKKLKPEIREIFELANIEKTYNKNLEFLKSIIGLEIKTAIQEQYFYKGILDKESLGTLKLEFTNGYELTFDCNQDAQTIQILNGGFGDKGTLETDFEDNRYKWKTKDFLKKCQLIKLGKIKSCYIEWSESEYFKKYQSGCKIMFENGDFLYIWTEMCDNIFYKMNEYSPHHKEEFLITELIEIENNNVC